MDWYRNRGIERERERELKGKKEEGSDMEKINLKIMKGGGGKRYACM